MLWWVDSIPKCLLSVNLLVIVVGSSCRRRAQYCAGATPNPLVAVEEELQRCDTRCRRFCGQWVAMDAKAQPSKNTTGRG